MGAPGRPLADKITIMVVSAPPPLPRGASWVTTWASGRKSYDRSLACQGEQGHSCRVFSRCSMCESVTCEPTPRISRYRCAMCLQGSRRGRSCATQTWRSRPGDAGDRRSTDLSCRMVGGDGLSCRGLRGANREVGSGGCVAEPACGGSEVHNRHGVCPEGCALRRASRALEWVPRK